MNIKRPFASVKIQIGKDVSGELTDGYAWAFLIGGCAFWSLFLITCLLHLFKFIFG